MPPTNSASLDLAYVEDLIEHDPLLQATKPRVLLADNAVTVQVEGASREARCWRHAVGGRIFPSEMDHGVRRQRVLASRCQVVVEEHPAVTR